MVTRTRKSIVRDLLALSLTLTAVLLMPALANADATAKAVYKDAVGSVVLIQTSTTSGTGFSFGRPGEYLTNAHVVGTSKTFQIKDYQGHAATATVLKVDPSRDVALIKSDLELPALSPPTQNVATGDDAYTIGNPEGQDFTFTNGTISRVDRVVGGRAFIQIDVPVNHGNSGGPLLNDKAEVVGITSQVLYEKDKLWGLIPGSRTNNIAFAIPIIEGAKSVGADTAVPDNPPPHSGGGNQAKKTSGKPTDAISISWGTIKLALVGLILVIAALLIGVRLGRRGRASHGTSAMPIDDQGPQQTTSPAAIHVPQPVPQAAVDDDIPIIIRSREHDDEPDPEIDTHQPSEE